MQKLLRLVSFFQLRLSSTLFQTLAHRYTRTCAHTHPATHLPPLLLQSAISQRNYSVFQPLYLKICLFSIRARV